MSLKDSNFPQGKSFCLPRSLLLRLLYALFILGVIPKFVLAQEAIPVPFATPLQELNRIQQDCEERGVSGFMETRASLTKCFAEAGMRNVGIVNQCDQQKAQHECFQPVMKKIDECIPGRGSTVGLIYATLLDITCQNIDVLKTFTPNEICTPDPDRSNVTTDACDKISEMSSPDLCISFKAQRKCEESKIMPCNRQKHKQLILNFMERVNLILKCNNNPVLTSESKPKVPITSAGSKIFQISIFSMISFWILLSG